MRTAEALQRVEPPGWRPGERPERNLERIVRTLELQVPGTRGHSRRVAVYAALTAQRIGLERSEIDRVRRAAAIHDVGKIAVPVELLNRPDQLGDEEFAGVQRHAVAGAELVAQLNDPKLTEIVLHHHERFDGEGYPDGLAGEKIPIGARIVAVADTFDAVTSVRPYRPPLTHPEALALLEVEAGMQLDPEVVAAFRVHCSGLRGVLMSVRRR
jgi:HD-GYP domain-containing protein (c-di-GMP phosphodiesterase class II)